MNKIKVNIDELAIPLWALAKKGPGTLSFKEIIKAFNDDCNVYYQCSCDSPSKFQSVTCEDLTAKSKSKALETKIKKEKAVIELQVNNSIAFLISKIENLEKEIALLKKQ